MILGPSSREFKLAYGDSIDASFVSWATNAANIFHRRVSGLIKRVSITYTVSPGCRSSTFAREG